MHERRTRGGLLQQIGSGMTADVFRTDNGEVIKLFKPQFDEGAARYEIFLLEAISRTSLKCPQYLRTEIVDGRIGMVTSFVPGATLMEEILGKPLKSFSLIKQFASAHFEISKIECSRLPNEAERFRHLIAKEELLSPFSTALLEYLAKLPQGRAVCHGDFHCGNVILSDGELTTVDWMNAYSGSPQGDALRSYLMFLSPFDPLNLRPFKKVIFLTFKRILGSIYLSEYLKLTGYKRAELMRWLPVAAALRVTDHVPNETSWLMKMIKK